MSGNRRFASPVLMERAVDMYFAEREVDGKLPTLSGLALSLGFNSLGSLRNYEGYDEGEYAKVIGRARLRIMDTLEQLAAQGRTSAQFLLKNIDKDEWRDRSETALDVKDERQEMSAIERANRIEALIQQVRQEKIVNSIPHIDNQEDDNSWME